MNYAELKAKKEQLQKMLNAHSDMKSHRTYRAIEHQLKEVKQQISQIFRDQHNAKSGNN